MFEDRYDEGGNRLRIARLSDRGVNVWGSDHVYISPDVPVESIEPGATIFNGAISGQKTFIGRGAKVGRSGHARVHDCQIGRDCEIGAGTYEGATLLEGAAVRGFAELRPGTLLEEQVEAAHSVAFKNTVLTATCVTGSLINYCDLFMSGGTSREDHSEVGSGVVHFNFDPRQDKWGSLLGDVRGVLLRSAPVFVGGQVGLVAPVHVDFGAVVAAGSIVRHDVGPGCVHFENARSQNVDGFDREIYTGLKRKFLSTANLIGNLAALSSWYAEVRLPFADSDQVVLYEAAREQLQRHIDERVKRITKIIRKLPRSLEKWGDRVRADLRDEHEMLIEQHSHIEGALIRPPHGAPPERLLHEYEAARKEKSHIESVRALSPDAVDIASKWLAELAAAPARRLDAVFHS
jgi:UDP-N-acetylglucosamine/UDP-N-acetylgalactosamine diphosphorylase